MVKITLKKKHTDDYIQDLRDIDNLMFEVDQLDEFDNFTSILEGFINNDADFGSAMLGGEEITMDAAPFDSVYDNIICGDVHQPPQCVISYYC